MIQSDIKIIESKEHLHLNNLHWKERQALQTLAEDPDVVIKEADKGGGIVILDKTMYITEVERQLTD